MIEVFNNPLLLDFIKVCARMPDDERAQLAAVTGEAYDIDRAAMGNFMVQGPKWVIKVDGEPIAIGGFAPRRPGVWQDFMINTTETWGRHWFPVTRIARRAVDAMFMSGQAHRIECIVPVSRLGSRPELERWYEAIGYYREGIRYRYCATGEDAVSFARVKH
jgi:hypothetical protein